MMIEGNKKEIVMLQLYLFSFFGGLFITNGIPHFVRGVTGQKNQTPFGKPSSATVNVLWGWSNIIVGAILLCFADIHKNEAATFILVAIAVLLKALGSARIWSQHPEYNK